MGADFKNGVAAAVPGWENVRLLAPHAELRLLVCGESTIIDAHRLRWQMPPIELVSFMPCICPAWRD